MVKKTKELKEAQKEQEKREKPSETKEIIKIIKGEEKVSKEDLKKIKRAKKILETVRIKVAKEKSLKTSIKEGSYASVSQSLTDYYASPFALALGANNVQIGLLSSLPGLIGPISEISGTKLMEKNTRKKIVTRIVFWQAAVFLPIMLLAFLFLKKILVSYLSWFLILLIIGYAILGNLSTPAWFSWMGDLVPVERRGRYFAKRSRIVGAIGISTVLLVGFFLDFTKTRGLVLAGFAILFLIAMLSRFFSANYLKKQYEPKFKLEKKYYFSFWQFLKKMPYTNFGKFVIFVFLLYFGIAFASPFFTVYMLKDLKLSYVWFIMISMSVSISTLFIISIWGKIADKYGNRILLKAAAIFIPIYSFLWIFNRNPIYLLIVPGFFGSLGWAAFNLASGNFIYDAVKIEKRALCVSYYNILIGAGVFLGATIGGLFAQFVEISFMNKFLFMFLLSGILRVIPGIILLPMIKEVRKVEKFPSLHFTGFRLFHAAAGKISPIVHGKERK